jgi:hypothetical protein
VQRHCEANDDHPHLRHTIDTVRRILGDDGELDPSTDCVPHAAALDELSTAQQYCQQAGWPTCSVVLTAVQETLECTQKPSLSDRTLREAIAADPTVPEGADLDEMTDQLRDRIAAAETAANE